MFTGAPDERLSKYEIVRPLGSGGMGEVYLAFDKVLNRDVAIKFVSADRIADPAAEQRLLREAQAAAALDHPSICGVHDVHIGPDGRVCIVMQYVEGETLAERLRRGPLPARQALALVTDIAEGLAVAHARHVVHRDLKPQNIMVTPSGRPKLLDFGIALMQVPQEEGSTSTKTVTSVTTGRAVAGSPAYMSPEQILQRPIDGRSDLFSLGLILYECLTGRSAFLGASKMETWSAVLHTDPPKVSSLAPELTEAHDELCRRLMAKEPGERFQSAEELLGALRVIGSTTRDTGITHEAPRSRRPSAIAGVAVVLLAVLAVVAWQMNRPPALPEPPAEAQRWYERGTEHLRNGAYYSAQQALNQAIALAPNYVQAYARLAESQSELDEENGAREALLRASSILVDPSQLPAIDRARFAAIRAYVLRDLPTAQREYQGIVGASPGDPRAWLDLARVKAAAGFRAEAAADYRQAVKLDSQNAAAHLRLGELAAQQTRRDEALAEFQEAERLYRAASDVEGQTEAILQRADFLQGLGELPAAREAHAAAERIAKQTGNRFQQIRAQLILSSITAVGGDFVRARTLAEESVTAAQRASLDTVAAAGLIELGSALIRSRELRAAKTELERAIDLAKRRGAFRLAARGTLQLGGLFLLNQQPQDALNVVQGVLPFLKSRQFRRYELVALTIMARSYEDLADYERARPLAEEVLKVAETMKDDGEVAGALESLAGQAAATGRLPEALALRERREAIHRRNQNNAGLAFDLTSRAELLIRLGRADAAAATLDELEAGIAAKVGAFVSRGRRALVLRALAATTQQRFAAAETATARVIEEPRSDTTHRLAVVLHRHARARLGRPPGAADGLTALDTDGSLAFRRELQYWRAAARLARGDFAAALTDVDAALGEMSRAPSAEGEWRLAALGAAAARRLPDPAKADAYAGRARDALGRLRTAWKADAASYEKRPDLVERKRDAGLDQP
jgi:tetratricopeptide (TPR) repeat protein